MALQKEKSKEKLPLPEWFKVPLAKGPEVEQLKHISKTLGLATVCEQARCPNLGECWATGTATFMLMGEICTRGCRFCAVKTGNPNGWLDRGEPEKIAQVVAKAGWRYVVLTSVDRDDLPDGGAEHFAQTVEAIFKVAPNTLVEVLIPDFAGQQDALERLLEAKPQVVAQNIETVERLTHPIRDKRAGYQQTLQLLAKVKQLSPATITKSSIMLGLGEEEVEVYQAMKDLRAVGVDIVTLGQYLQPTPKHWPVARYILPDEFKAYQHWAETKGGFAFCASGPLVRSSYKAAEVMATNLLKQQVRLA